MKGKTRQLIGFSALFASAAIFGSFGIWIRILNNDLTANQQIVFRNIWAFVFSIIFILLRKTRVTKVKKTKGLNLLAYALVVPLAVILYNFAILETKIAVATFSFYAGTILSSWVFGIFVFKEKISKIDLASLLLVLLGIGGLVYPFSVQAISMGLIYALVSGLLDSLGNVFRKDLSSQFDKFILVLLTTIGGVGVSAIMILYFGDPLNFIPQLSLNSWFVGSIFGFLLIAVNYLLLVGFQNFDLSLGSIVLSAELFFALIFGIVFLREIPATNEMLGGGFILLASCLPSISSFLKSKRPKGN